MTLFTRRFIRDNGDKLEVDGSYRISGNTGASFELLDYKAWLWEDRNNTSAPFVELTDAESERLSEEICADQTTWEYPDDYD